MYSRMISLVIFFQSSERSSIVRKRSSHMGCPPKKVLPNYSRFRSEFRAGFKKNCGKVSGSLHPSNPSCAMAGPRLTCRVRSYQGASGREWEPGLSP